MAIVITNGTNYLRYSGKGGTKFTKDITEAFLFPSVSNAIKGMRKAPEKTKNYVVLDTLTNRVLWKWMTDAEKIEIAEEKQKLWETKRDKGRKIKRKRYSQDVRKMIYNKAGGRCELCGRKILFSDMTLDHVVPLSMGGIDAVENLACVCYPDNVFKGNILPDDFLERISLIYLYQMGKKHKDKLRWKIVHKILEGME